jgi:signal transduction histidine kinase
MVRITDLRSQDPHRFEAALAQRIEHRALKAAFGRFTKDFRAPLAVIQSSQELLRHYGDRLEPRDREAVVAELGTAVQSLRALVDEVVAVGQAGATPWRFSPAPVDPAALCRRLCDEVVARHQARGRARGRILLDAQPDLGQCVLDPALLRTALGGVLVNALKYSRGAEVTLALARVDGWLQFDVRDRGIGIARSALPRVFEQFLHAPAAGTGLGLAVARHAAEAHGGAITVESQLGHGSVFTLRVPLGVLPAQRP